MRKVALAGLMLLLSACSYETTVQTVACPDPIAGCRLDEAVSVRFSQTPGVMEKFALDVHAPKNAEPYASFQMQGMDMGPNRYRLLWNGGVWHADVMLPACVQGRRDWVLRLEVGKKIYEMPFVSR